MTGKPLQPALDHAGHHYYLDDMHPVNCTACPCAHYRERGLAAGECVCGDRVHLHRFDRVRACVTEAQIRAAEANAARLNRAYGLGR
jgi:hypothetical protein